MQDEIVKHTERIYKTAKNSEHSFLKKIEEILIEIFIIVFAVTLSIGLHNWSEHRSQQKEVKDFLADLKEDVTRDIQSLNEKKSHLSNLLKSYAVIKKLTPRQADTAKNISLDFSLTTLKNNTGDYEGFRSSGKIGFIENKKLKKMVLEYYQESLPNLYDVEKYRYSKELETFEMINSFNKPQNKLLGDPAIRARLNLNAIISEALVSACNQVIQLATEILKEIEKEINQ